LDVILAEGRALAPSMVLAEARDWLTAIAGGTSGASQPPSQGPQAAPQAATRAASPRVRRVVELTAREREILHLLGQRLTNLEIADRLFIGERTVESHVSRILGKLGATNRRDVAAIAARLSLF
jgi:DNA-binding CsgD family transcriptional regulator